MGKRGKSGRKKERKPLNLVFDEQKRREFLTGFHKRKLQRKKHAQEKLAKQLKDEKKRIIQEAKEPYKKLVMSTRTIPELEEILSSKEYNDDDVTVRITELSKAQIAEENHWIGENRPACESDQESESDDSSASNADRIPGMETEPAKVKKKPKADEKPKFSSVKEAKKAVQKEATRKMLKSKLFQKKTLKEKLKNKKKHMRQKRLIEKKKKKKPINR